jgi:hypothetical protein
VATISRPAKGAGVKAVPMAAKQAAGGNGEWQEF